MRSWWVPLAGDAVSRARMPLRIDFEAVRLPVAGVGSAESPTEGNLVPFRAIAAQDFSGVADAVWVGETDDDCPMCSNPCISNPERTE